MNSDIKYYILLLLKNSDLHIIAHFWLNTFFFRENKQQSITGTPFFMETLDVRTKKNIQLENSFLCVILCKSPHRHGTTIDWAFLASHLPHINNLIYFYRFGSIFLGPSILCLTLQKKKKHMLIFALCE